jgi:hypothetical protein
VPRCDSEAGERTRPDAALLHARDGVRLGGEESSTCARFGGLDRQLAHGSKAVVLRSASTAPSLCCGRRRLPRDYRQAACGIAANGPRERPKSAAHDMHPVRPIALGPESALGVWTG